MEDMAFALNYHNRQEGIVDYRILNWLRDYLTQGACTTSTGGSYWSNCLLLLCRAVCGCAYRQTEAAILGG
jgi:hypothetical protein